MRSYKEMIHDARKKGVTSEQAMNRSIEDVSDLLDSIKYAHEEEYMQFMRKTHERLYGCHYDECMAKEDVAWMWHTNDKGEKVQGECWTKDEVVNAWQGKAFPAGTTDWDKYVAANIGKHDFGKVFNDTDCLKIAYQFFFCDEDSAEGKTWCYVSGL